MDSMRRHSSEVKTCQGKANPASRVIGNSPVNEYLLRETSETSFSAVEIRVLRSKGRRWTVEVVRPSHKRETAATRMSMNSALRRHHAKAC